MPNWCSNTLSISGPTNELESFRLKAIGPTQNYNDFRAGVWEAFEDIRLRAIISTTPELGEVSDLSFHALYPVPDEVMRFPYDSNQAKKIADRCGVEFGGRAGYEWENSNWGVKWGGTDTHTHHCDDMLQYEFDTAWCPPQGIYNKLIEQFQTQIKDGKLHISWFYREEGMQFAGYLNENDSF